VDVEPLKPAYAHSYSPPQHAAEDAQNEADEQMLPSLTEQDEGVWIQIRFTRNHWPFSTVLTVWIHAQNP